MTARMPAPREFAPLPVACWEIAQHVTQGEPNGQIAKALGFSPHTIKNYLTQIYSSTGTTNRIELAVWLARRTK